MSMTIDKKKIPRHLDKRVKLSLEQREEINKLYKTGNYSQRELASLYGVSRRLITFYTDKKKLDRNREVSKKNLYYYDKEKRKHYMRSHRASKRALEKEGLLI